MIRLGINMITRVRVSLAREIASMKDIPRSKEEEGRRGVFKEEMMRRAEETRSFMMTKHIITNNGIGGRDSRRMSPNSLGHQSVIDIKVRVIDCLSFLKDHLFLDRKRTRS